MRVVRRRSGRAGKSGLALVAAIVTAVLAVAAAQAGSRAVPAPSAKTPISIRYSGTFDLSNKLVPQNIPSSYAYHVEWVQFWSGRWGQL